MTEMERSDDGTWLVRPTTGEGERTPNPAYLDKIATHLTALDPVFKSARKRRSISSSGSTYTSLRRRSPTSYLRT